MIAKSSTLSTNASGSLEDLPAIARALVESALGLAHPKHGFSTASCQTYDTAWVAMITKMTSGQTTWLFPESFHYLLSTQASDGSWSGGDASQTTGIIDTAAALLALLKHASEPLQIQDYLPIELERRISLATESLKEQLAAWNDIETTNHIGVEFVVPALLEYLEQEDASKRFPSVNATQLARMASKKVAVASPTAVYQSGSSPYVYLLEAFVGKIDFDKIAHQRFRNGSMWTSPAATAAYLINASTWDDEAEEYLRHVIRAGQGHGAGGVPGTFPTDLFEFDWILVTLLQSGFGPADLGPDSFERVASIVKQSFIELRGVIGHASQAIDADDTAKGLLALRLMGKEEGVSPDPLIKIFERQECFSTFGSERDRSLSTNCHILATLLAWDRPLQYAEQIRKATRFITRYYWEFVGRCKDKWHLSALYPRMLTVKTFTELLRLSDANPSSDLLDAELRCKLSIVLFQACVRTALEQKKDGSWDDSTEQTSYAVIALAEARHVCLFTDFVPRFQSSIDAAVTYLQTSEKTSAMDCHWTSKTSYSLKFVREAYRIAALRLSTPIDVPGNVGRETGLLQELPSVRDTQSLFGRTPHFSSMKEWLLRASLAESALWLPLLRARRLEIFPRDDQNIAKDAYFDLLPALWTACSYRAMNFVPNTFIHDMLFMTLVNIQIDEFNEGAVTSTYEDDGLALHLLIDQIVDDTAKAWFDSVPETNGQHEINGRRETDGDHTVKATDERLKVAKVLSRFASLVLGNGARASVNDRASLEREFRSFLHTQAAQMEDNKTFGQQIQGKGCMFDAPLPYFQWVRTVAADHVSTPFSWAWVCCWTSAHLGQGGQVFGTPTENYLAAATARHLATTNRMYNDLGSVKRDTAEGNINSVHFPEFSANHDIELTAQKRALRSLAEYEHSCVINTRRRLEEEVLRANPGAPENSFARQKLYTTGLLCDVASLWDQLYSLRDLSSTIPARSVEV